ncbi:MAG: GGDEF domain-containing protein [Treponema sp.]|nr:GGDEF domain-containing protein [Treponema sp.]
MALSFCISLAFMILIPAHSKEDLKNQRLLVAEHIYDSIHTEFLRPLTISNVMAKDFFLCEVLKKETSLSEKEMEKTISDYLTTITNRTGYIAAYVISDKTRRYYSPKGIEKVMDPRKDPYDIWYDLFLDKGADWDLDTDRDQANGYRWTVFVNVRIVDADGTYLGVAGVGLFIDALQTLIEQFELKYDVKINLVEKDGLVQVDTSMLNIENAYIADVAANNAGLNEFTYVKRGINTFRVTRYVDDLEWYLVIQGEYIDKTAFDWKKTFALTIVLSVSMLALLILFWRYGLNDEQKQSTDPSRDSLTGLPNRNYFTEAYGEAGIFNTTRYKSLAVFDIDKFRLANDTINGDSLILSVTELARQIIADQGLILRWEGDEFMVLLELDADVAEPLFSDFCTKVSQQCNATISIGIIQINLADTVKMNYYRAVQLCYAAKADGGGMVKRL